MNRRSHHETLLVALAVSFVLMGALSPAAGQVGGLEDVSLYGRVQWIAGEKMMIVTDCRLLESNCTSFAVAIDLARVPLSEYRGIRAGSWVLVEGSVVHQNAHPVIATSVILVEEWQVP